MTVCLCERSLTRVVGSVTLAMDKARKGAWSEEGKGSAAHARGKPGKEVARVVKETLLGWLFGVCIGRRMRDGRRLCTGDRPGDNVEQGASLQPRQRHGGGGPEGFHPALSAACSGGAPCQRDLGRHPRRESGSARGRRGLSGGHC